MEHRKTQNLWRKAKSGNSGILHLIVILILFCFRQKKEQATLTGYPTLEQKRSFHLEFGPIRLKFGPHAFFWKFLVDVEIVPSCNIVQYEGKLMMQI